MPPARRLPDFPWDALAPYRERARAHPEGVVDLSVGTPVDPTPTVVREALAAASDWPGYPTTHGTGALREAVVGWLDRVAGVADVDPVAVLPTIGSKELVAWLPTLVGLGVGEAVMFPEVAYPTYDVGTRLAGAEPVPYGLDAAFGTGGTPPAVRTSAGSRVRLVWLNSPSNPTGRVWSAPMLARAVAWARDHDVLLVSDECYLEFPYAEPQPVTVLHPDVSGGSHEGLLAVHSLSKRSNLAGYRAGFVAGDARVVAELLEVRKHAGMIVPGPVQAAATAAYGDDAHVAEQRERYRSRRARLLPALTGAGFDVTDSTAGLYLWATRTEDCWTTVGWLAERGIVVAPGAFYGAAGSRHVRVALTATDERVAEAARRLE